MTTKDVWFVNAVSQIGEAEELCPDSAESSSADVDLIAMMIIRALTVWICEAQCDRITTEEH